MTPLAILIVDDNPISSQILAETLKKLGHTIVATAGTGAEAVTTYRSVQPDFVTMDVMMPDMDGIAATKAIVSEFPGAVIVMVTSRDEDKVVLDALKAGAKGYILKPFEPERVAEVVEAARKRMI